MDKYQFLKEEERLDYTLQTLNEEILNYIEKRKEIANYILDYRKNFIEEHKDDEDALMEYFDHERYVKEESYKQIDKKLMELTKLKETPYFGKVIFSDEDECQEEIYVGRYGLTKDATFENVIIDWRAPIASLFYKGSLGPATYKTPDGELPADILARRQFVIKKGSLQGYFDSEVDVKDEILQMILSSNSGEKLKDIVMTIQQEQDDIIREERMKVVVVNGVAGSGKTTIALHRVAYLLYNYRQQLGNKVLVLGPNDIFVDYISEILPTLGESDVAEETFAGFAMKEIGLTEDVLDFTAYLEEVLKENEEVVPLNEVEDLFEKHYKYMPLFRRSQKVKRVLISKLKDKRDEKVREINAAFKAKLEAMSDEEKNIEQNNLEFQRRNDIRDVVREVMNVKAELENWIDNESIVDIYKKFMNIDMLSYLDLPAILYLMIKLDGKKSKAEIKHIVIDEAQDYSMLQFLVLQGLTGCRSYTVVGDVNQRLVKIDEVPAMLRLEELYGKFVKRFDLNKSYRSTQQIMEYASKLLDENAIVPFVRKGKYDVEEVEINDKEDLIDTILETLEEYDDENYENIAVITKDKDELQRIAPELKKFTKIMAFDKADIIYRGGKVIVPSYYAKGLEFDGVIVVNFDDNTDDLVKYIMATRALHQLKIINYKGK